jgi:hypothetical protein
MTISLLASRVSPKRGALSDVNKRILTHFKEGVVVERPQHYNTQSMIHFILHFSWDGIDFSRFVDFLKVNYLHLA